MGSRPDPRPGTVPGPESLHSATDVDRGLAVLAATRDRTDAAAGRGDEVVHGALQIEECCVV
jgi:hypothetical protein